MNSYKVDAPLDFMAQRCKKRLKYGGDDNYHVFINSVEGISRIIRLADLSPKDCRIICSQSEGERKKRNQEKLPDGFKIESTLDKVKLFNFYTSTCFEGQDIMDENGRIFIVSEKYKDYTKMDISTTLVQICGRIRDSKYNTEINQYYATSKYKDVSFEKFMETVYRDLHAAENDAKEMNAMLERLSQDASDFIKSYAYKKPYLTIIDGKLAADVNAANVEIVNYGVVNGQYATQCNMNNALKEAGLVVNETIPEERPEVHLGNVTRSIARCPFKDIFEEYCSLREGAIKYDLTLRANQIEREKPLVKEAYEKLGPNKVRELKYHQYNIKREIVTVSHNDLSTKIFLLVDKQLPKGVAIPKSTIKNLLQDIYGQLGSTKTANAEDLKDWYNVEEKRKRGYSGACLAIVSAKYKVTKQIKQE